MAEKGQRVRNRSAANSGRIPFAPAYVPELYDSRLTSDEKILLWKIRYRAGVKGATWISWETMAKESPKSRSTMMRQIKKLRDLGFLVTGSRGFGMTTDKVVECPTAIYPSDLCDSHTVGKYFSRDREDGELSELMSKCLSSPTSETTDDKSDDQAPRKCHQWDSISVTGDTSVVSPVTLELDKSKLNKNKLDPSPPGRRWNQQAGPSVVVEDGTGEDLTPDPTFANCLENSLRGKIDPPQGDPRDLDAIRGLQDVRSRETLDTARDKHEERRARKAGRDASGLTGRYREHVKELQEESHKPAYRMFLFFGPVFMNYFPRDRFPGAWGRREYIQSNNLLKKFDDDFELICEAWVYSCKNWDVIKKKLRLTEGHPTIGALLAFQDRIFPMLSKSNTKREDVEGKGGQVKKKFGW